MWKWNNISNRIYNGKLVFEGEYLNSKRNGKGKEYYDNGNLKFEGEYLIDYKIKGKCYIDQKLEFEGEFRYDRKWNGKGYDENGNITYELKDGNGKVKEYNDDGYLVFEGEYLNGQRNGKGKEYNDKGIINYYGEYLDGQRWNGLGINRYDYITDILEYINGSKNIVY